MGGGPEYYEQQMQQELYEPVEEVKEDLHPVTRMVDEFSNQFEYGPWIVLVILAAGITHYSGIILSTFLRRIGLRKYNRRRSDAKDQ